MRISSNWYTEAKLVKHSYYLSSPLNKYILDGNDDRRKYYFSYDKSKDGTLFSLSKHKTKLSKNDLPFWYIDVNINGITGYINLKNITDICIEKIGDYDYPIREYTLYIKFDGKFDDKFYDGIDKCDLVIDCIKYDLSCMGFDVVRVLAGLNAFNNLREKAIKYYEYVIECTEKYYKYNTYDDDNDENIRYLNKAKYDYDYTYDSINRCIKSVWEKPNKYTLCKNGDKYFTSTEHLFIYNKYNYLIKDQ